MKILRRQSLRNLKKEWFKYFSVFILIAVGLALIISVSNASDSIDFALRDLEKETNVEDGEFVLFVPLNDSQKIELQNNGVEIEECFYINISYKNTMLRVFKNRKKMNMVKIKEGSIARKTDEIVIEQHYAKKHSLDIGSSITLDGKTFSIVGLGYSIDYDSSLEQMDAAYPNSETFGTCFVSDESFNKMMENNKAEYNYAYSLKGKYDDDKLFSWLSEMQFDETKVSDKYMNQIIDDVNDKISEFTKGADKVVDGIKDLYDGINSYNINGQMQPLSAGVSTLYDNSKDLREAVYDVSDEYLNVDWENLVSFTPKNDNRRIVDYRDFVSTNKYCALPIGAALILSLAFLIAVISANEIKKQSKTIGTLYAMGYKSGELTATFIVPPVLVVFLSSLSGTIAGFKLTFLFTKDYVANGCIVDLPIAYPIYLLLYGIVLPTVVAVLVNWIVIKYTLSKPVLSMLRNTNIEVKNIEIGLVNMKFKKKFQFRLFFREISSFILLFISLIMTIFMMVFSVTLYGTLDTWVKGCEEDIQYKYKYYYRFPSDEIPNGGEALFYKGMQATLELTGSQLDVEVWGLPKNSKYFDYDLSGSKKEIYITDSTKDKFGWDKGDKIYLSSRMGNDAYCFTIAGIVDYSTGLYLFMDIDNMRDVFGEESDYWNLVLSNKKLDIDNNRLAATITKEDTVVGAKRRTDSLMGIVYMLMGMGIFIFVGIFYMMMKLITEKSMNSISVLKIMGYRQSEIQRLYLTNPIYVIILSTIISVPLSKWIVSLIYPLIISNVTTGMPVVLPINLLLMLIGIIFVSWLVTHLLLNKKICNIEPVQILRNNE